MSRGQDALSTARQVPALGARVFSGEGGVCSQPPTAVTAPLRPHQRDLGFLPLLRVLMVFKLLLLLQRCPSALLSLLTWAAKQDRLSGCLEAAGTGVPHLREG